MSSQPVRKLFHEHDYQQAVLLRELAEALAQQLCAESMVVEGGNQRITSEPIENGRRRAAVALGLVPVAVLINLDEVASEDKLALRIRSRCTGEPYDDNLESLEYHNSLEGAPSNPPQSPAGFDQDWNLPLLKTGTIVKLNSIPLELAASVPVHGDVAYAMSLADETQTGPGCADPRIGADAEAVQVPGEMIEIPGDAYPPDVARRLETASGDEPAAHSASDTPEANADDQLALVGEAKAAPDTSDALSNVSDQKPVTQ